VRAITRIATPDCEAALLEFATAATASQTERFCRTWRRADDDAGSPGAEPRPEVGQSFDVWTDDEGFLTFKIRMRPEEGHPFLARIDALAERDARRERAQNTKARARHAQIRAAGGRVDRAVDERCAADATVGLARERTAARRIAALGALAEARVDLDRRPGDPPRREVVVHVDAAVLAADTAAGRAHYQGGPAITAATARRLLCGATAIMMLEAGGEPLAVGRGRRRATRAQRRALLRRDGGCARPGCPETRPERLHAHHLRHWLFGGRTDLANLVLLCDTDHGLVHDHDLILRRREGRLIVTTPDGRHLWGTADAAFTTGLAGLDTDQSADPVHGTEAFLGVHPIDDQVARRPADAPPLDPDTATPPPPARLLPRRPSTPRGPGPRRPGQRRPGQRQATADAGRPGRPPNRQPARAGVRPAAAPPEPAREGACLSRLLFPDGEPSLPDTLQETYDRMDLRYAIDVLMGNRDLARRLAAEAGVPVTG
jgi:hypothetical protein